MNMSSILGSVLLLCIGYFAGWMVHQQYLMLKERHRRQQVRKELDRILNDR
jgi:hypothetical protein